MIWKNPNRVVATSVFGWGYGGVFIRPDSDRALGLDDQLTMVQREYLRELFEGSLFLGGEFENSKRRKIHIRPHESEVQPASRYLIFFFIIPSDIIPRPPKKLFQPQYFEEKKTIDNPIISVPRPRTQRLFHPNSIFANYVTAQPTPPCKKIKVNPHTNLRGQIMLSNQKTP